MLLNTKDYVSDPFYTWIIRFNIQDENSREEYGTGSPHVVSQKLKLERCLSQDTSQAVKL
jgi:hypothetical protein